LNLRGDRVQLERISAGDSLVSRSLPPAAVKQFPTCSDAITILGLGVLGDLQQDVGKA
jgi:hypothetical protein